MKEALQKLNLGRLNHVAMAVPNLASASAQWSQVFGAKVSAPVDLPEHGVTTVFVELSNTKFELLGVLGDKSPIQGFLDKNPRGGIHHVCIEVDDIGAAHQTIKKAGIRTTSAEPKIGAHGLPVLFLHPVDTNGFLIELEQRKKD